MAIDYRDEWGKFRTYYGARCVETKVSEVGQGVPATTLSNLMDGWIRDIINSREKLMEEYVKAQIETEIIGADGGYHRVKLEVFGESRGTVPVSKNAFNTWIRNKGKKRKEVR